MPDLLAHPPRHPNPLLVFAMRRSTAIAVGLSLLVHLLALVLFHQQPLTQGFEPTRAPIAARLRERAPPPTAVVEAPVVAPVPPPERPPTPVPRHREPTRAPVIARREPAPRSVAVEPPPPPPQPAANADPQTDFMANTRARQERRAAFNDMVAANSSGSEPTEDERRNARIAENVKARPGVSGVFMVIFPLGQREATFKFRGWTSSARDSYTQAFTVDAGVGGNVELAVVRRMIQLIREHYQGNFNWESARNGIVVLSAAPENNAELEQYLRREFFGQPH